MFRNLPQVTKNIIIINILVLIMMSLDSRNIVLQYCALYYFGSPNFHIWQPFTYMFLHGGFWHIFFNMYTLLIFGVALEHVWGPKRFLLFYVVTGVGAGLFHMGVQWLEAQSYMANIAEGSQMAVMQMAALNNIPTVGASGAIYGVLLGYAMLFPDSRLTLLFPPVTLTAKWFVIIFAGIEVLTGVVGTADGVAHFAHLGGMLFALVLILYWKKKCTMYDYYE